MFLAALKISREGYYPGSYQRPDPSKPLHATVEIMGAQGKTELNLGPEASARLIAVIQDELVASARATAEAMTADMLTVPALPAE